MDTAVRSTIFGFCCNFLFRGGRVPPISTSKELTCVKDF
ncbi:hypothetical protein VP5_gp43 [Vibrio phage VP5]|nr:hypothetical protein VP5_gp43 [Vibrio phage VP5]